MISRLMKTLRRMSKTRGGCTKLWLLLVSSCIILYTLNNMWIEKEPERTLMWDDEDRAPTVESNNTVLAHNVCHVACKPDQFSFYIRSGEKTDKGPIICFQGELYMGGDLMNVHRGLNVVIINYKTQIARSVKSYDTYEDDEPDTLTGRETVKCIVLGDDTDLLRLLKKRVTSDEIILVASFDDASQRLDQGTRVWLSKYGSKLIHKLGMRENFIMVGMRGLEQGKAIEKYSSRKHSQFADVIEEAGCFSVPMGKMTEVAHFDFKVLNASEIKYGERFDNCGLPQPCPSNSMSVSISTGGRNKAVPNVCINGFVLMAANLNNAGRGFNIITVNPNTFQAESFLRVDSYVTESSDIDFFFETLTEGTLVIIVIADEAATKLKLNTKDLLNQKGSGYIQNLRFRDIWYMVTQIGIQGFTTFEEIRYAPYSRDWPSPLQNKFCVPNKIPSSLTIPEPGVSRNEKRREFCTKHEGYTDFCNSAYVDDALKTIDLYTKELKGHDVYNTPVILVPGMDHNAFVNTLQTTLLQPGIKQDLVAVFWDEKLPEYKDLANLFGFREYVIDSSTSYSEQLVKAMMKAKLAYSNASHFIVIEEDLLLAPDFLPFMAACHDAMKKDESIVGASSWNFNGFQKMSGKANEVYRVKDFPGLGFMMKRSVIVKLVESMGQCCKERAWFGWQTELTGKEMLIPALSRVYRMPLFGSMGGTDIARELFLQPRQTHLEPHPIKIDIKNLQSEQYETFIKNQVQLAKSLPQTIFDQCLKGVSSPPEIPPTFKGAAVVFYQQDQADDFKLLNKLCRCFGLVTLNKAQPKNMHNGLLRFYYHDHDIFLVGTSSRYYDTERHDEVLMDPDFFKARLNQRVTKSLTEIMTNHLSLPST